MSVFSETHGQMYSAMASEMVRNAGFQDSVNDILRAIVQRGFCLPNEAQSVDDLYDQYGAQDIME